ncbi:unnamed protein product [Caenorhabditis angaria]|uniref:G protein-coupled receptor n=1 Tax=Caenorhabditis angaria TaxID=860376 RepID=A0A9P1IZB8_9PELO|nr:unnamed protein product [Caenorhabditis angaria]
MFSALPQSFFSYFCYSICGLGIFFNAILLFLSTHKSIETIRELRYFLSNIAASGLLFSACIGALQPQFVTRATMTIRVIHGPAQHLSDPTIQLMAASTIAIYLYAVLSFPLFFVYRSIILSNNAMFSQLFTKRNLLITFVITFLFCCAEGGVFYKACIDYDTLFDRLNRTTDIIEQFENNTIFLNQQIRNMDHGNGVITLGTTQSPLNNTHANNDSPEETFLKQHRLALIGDDYRKNQLIIVFHAIFVSAHVFSYVIVLLSAHIMLNILKRKQGSMSNDTFLENELLVHAVFAEAFVPLLLSAPVAANSVLVTVFENSLKWQEFLSMYFIGLVPVISPLCSMLFIGPYRRAIVGIFQKNKSNNKSDNNE